MPKTRTRKPGKTGGQLYIDNHEDKLRISGKAGKTPKPHVDKSVKHNAN